MTREARGFIAAVITAGGGALMYGLCFGNATDAGYFWVLPIVAGLASLLKFRLPGILATYSPASLVLLYGVLRGQLFATMVAACVAGVLPSVIRARPDVLWARLGFNVANLALSVLVSFQTLQLLHSFQWYEPANLALTACLYFTVNILLTSGVVALTSATEFGEVCSEWYVWTGPYYLTGAAVVGLLVASVPSIESTGWLLPLPLVYLVHFFSMLTRSNVSAGRPQTGSRLSREAAGYVYGVVAAGAIVGVAAMSHWATEDSVRLLAYVAATTTVSLLKIRLPGIRGTLSLNFVLLISAIAELHMSEALLLALMAAVVQSLWRSKRRPSAVQVSFNAACLILSTALAQLGYWWASGVLLLDSSLLILIPISVATLLLYLSNTLLVAVVLCLTENKPITRAWQQCNFWTLPYYLVGAAAAAMIIHGGRTGGWFTLLLILPVLAMVFVSYRLHVARLMARSVSASA